MKNKALLALAAVAAIGTAAIPAQAHDHGKKSHGASMQAQKNIVETAIGTPPLSTLVAAVKAAGLAGTLSSPGPFTVFAPTDTAFAKLPAGTVDLLVQPENKGTLTKILTYHVVAGKLDSKTIKKAIHAGGGTAVVTTVQGQKLKATISGNNLILTDAKGGRSAVAMADVQTSNGVVHVIDSVLMP